jgi:mRNA interferase MazF
MLMHGIKRGQVVWVDLNPVIGSEQGKKRPAVVIQNDIGNQHSSVTIVAPITSRIFDKEYLTNVYLPKSISGLKKDSTVLCNQLRTIDKRRIIRRGKILMKKYIPRLNRAIKVSLGL